MGDPPAQWLRLAPAPPTRATTTTRAANTTTTRQVSFGLRDLHSVELEYECKHGVHEWFEQD